MWRVAPTINNFALTYVAEGAWGIIGLQLALLMGLKEYLGSSNPFVFRHKEI